MSTRSFRRATLLLAFSTSFIAACGQSGSDLAGSSNAGQAGTYYNVSVFRPTHGKVTSTDGQIRCGSAPADSVCAADFAWNVSAVLNATPDAGWAFQNWAGDCQVAGPCVLNTQSSGADKYVVAVFVQSGELGHPNYTKQQDHGPAFFAYLGAKPNTPQCPSCHGANLQGQGIAPDCFTCHAQAGWVGWQTNCSFCHGLRDAQTKLGYALADHPEWSAPPDAIDQRLFGTAMPAKTGAHQQHMKGKTAAGLVLSAPWKCETCHPVPADYMHARSNPAIVNLAGAGQGNLPASLGSYSAAAGNCTTYCHGPTAVNWQATVTCGSCHGVPPATPSHAFLGTNPPTTSCSGCHAGTVNADGTINTTDGKHVNGNPDFGGGGSGCAGCHGYPSGSGAHAVHFGLVGAETGAAYGETDILEDRYPLATPTTAPSSYAFGCGNCHPTDLVKHFSGTVDIDLAPATAPAGSLKSLNAPTASYDRATGTCSGVYCHSSGQTTPTFVTTPAWRAVDPALGCDGCHTNPPRYPSGGAGTATANSHLQLQEDGYEWGHFLGLVGPWHTSQHGGAVAGEDSSPITCQTCHYETTDPSNTGPSRFYYLDTTGEYVIPGSLSTVAFKASITCTTCHNGVGNTARGTGKILPLRHVNGTRNVVFDARLTLDPTITWLPAAPNKPVQAYWMTSADVRNLWPSYVVWSGTTASFSFATSTYNPATKTCSNIACHLSQTNPVWGKPFLFRTGGIAVNCTQCHP